MPRERVLVVEDDPVVAELFRELLPDYGVELVVVADAEAGMDRLTEESFDLVVTDKNLPGRSGLELLEWIKKNNPDLPVIMMTAYGDMKSAVTAIHAGVYDYLLKPFDSLDEVVQKIQRALEFRRTRQENLRLIQYLTEANSQIEDMNQELETQVLDRTHELREANARLEELTVTDDVTGLYNQRFLYQRLEEEFARHRRYHVGVAVIMIDIDYFKSVNDDHDHLFGSRILERVGAVVLDKVRATDRVVRYGGDEFVVILPHADVAEAAGVAERIRAAIDGRDLGDPPGEGDGTETYGEPYHITASLGVAAVPECDADSPRSLLRHADKALYAAKAQGRNCVRIIRDGEPQEMAG